MKKGRIYSVLIVIILVTISFTGCFSDDDDSKNSNSKFDLQCIYYPMENSTIQLNELRLNKESEHNITNGTFSIVISNEEHDKSIEYNVKKNDDFLFIEFNEINLQPRLNIGFIEEDVRYSLKFFFKIISDDPNINNLRFWGDSNNINSSIEYNSKTGLDFDYDKNYSNVTWINSNDADIILTFPINLKFGIYLGIMED